MSERKVPELKVGSRFKFSRGKTIYTVTEIFVQREDFVEIEVEDNQEPDKCIQWMFDLTDHTGINIYKIFVYSIDKLGLSLDQVKDWEQTHAVGTASFNFDGEEFLL